MKLTVDVVFLFCVLGQQFLTLVIRYRHLKKANDGVVRRTSSRLFGFQELGELFANRAPGLT